MIIISQEVDSLMRLVMSQSNRLLSLPCYIWDATANNPLTWLAMALCSREATSKGWQGRIRLIMFRSVHLRTCTVAYPSDILCTMYRYNNNYYYALEDTYWFFAWFIAASKL